MTEFASVSGATGGTVTNVATDTSMYGGPITATGTLGVQVPIVPGGRLSFVTNTPIMTSSVTGATSHFWTPYNSRYCPIYDGTEFVITDLGGELSQAASDTTKSPAAVANNSNYDVFVWNDGGTKRATRGPLWTSNTARGTGAGTTELVLIKGVLLNAQSITNGPAAQRGTYVGSFRSNGTATLDWQLGSAASGGTAATLFCYNNYNRVWATAKVTDNGANYTYTTATIRQARASAGNQISWINGAAIAEEPGDFYYNAASQTVNVGAAQVQMGIGIDTTAAFFQQTMVFTQAGTAAAATWAAITRVIHNPGLGLHFAAALEFGDGANANTFDFSGANVLSGLLRM